MILALATSAIANPIETAADRFMAGEQHNASAMMADAEALGRAAGSLAGRLKTATAPAVAAVTVEAAKVTTAAKAETPALIDQAAASRKAAAAQISGFLTAARRVAEQTVK